MNANESADVTRKMLGQFNDHDLDEIVKYFAEDSEIIDVGHERSTGPEGARASIKVWLDAFPDASFEIRNINAGEDFAAVELVFRGTHDGALAVPGGAEVPATGRQLTGHGCIVFRFRDGKVSSEHDYFDRLMMMEQLGLAPAAEAQPAPAEELRATP